VPLLAGDTAADSKVPLLAPSSISRAGKHYLDSVKVHPSR
jgi:hypothetical protein